jgi:excisionase family DNA binding protein
MTQVSQRVQARINGEILDPQEVADFLKFSTRKVVRLLKKGELPGTKMGGQWRIRRIDLDNLLSKT